MEYELRSGDLPGARRVLHAAVRAMVGEEGGGSNAGGKGTAGGVFGGGGESCRAALLQEPFEELVRRMARSVSDGVEGAAKSKGNSSGNDGGGAIESGGGRNEGRQSDVTGRGGGADGFTEWGALLLRKEVRTLQQGLAALMETDSLNTEFGELNGLVRKKRSLSADEGICKEGNGEGGGGGDLWPCWITFIRSSSSCSVSAPSNFSVTAEALPLVVQDLRCKPPPYQSPAHFTYRF